MDNCYNYIKDYDLGCLCKLRDWIPIEKINVGRLSANPNAFRFLQQNPEKVDYVYLLMGQNVIYASDALLIKKVFGII